MKGIRKREGRKEKRQEGIRSEGTKMDREGKKIRKGKVNSSQKMADN